MLHEAEPFAKKNLKVSDSDLRAVPLPTKIFMKLIIRLFITSALVMILSYVMRGVRVDTFSTAIIVSVVLALLNLFIKPLIVLFTLPVTIFTLGLFLLVINALMILLCTEIVGGFEVDSFWTALLFSVILSLSQSILFRMLADDK